jgi:hypothetical protein
MKKLLLFLSLSLLSFITLTAQSTYDQNTKILQDKPYGVQRIAMDLDVYTVPSNQHPGMVNYTVEYYVKHGEELIAHKYMFTEAPESYNIASYTWESQKQFIMHIRHTDKPNKKTFRVTAGLGDTSTVEMIEE